MEERGRNGTHILSLYVANRPGTLARIAQTFSRRGFNIESLVVSPAADGKFSRMTISATGDGAVVEQVRRQCMKLVDVVTCQEHGAEDTVGLELALMKVAAEGEKRTEVLQIVDHFDGKTVDWTERTVMIEATGSTRKLDAMVSLLRHYGLKELVRTGKVQMARGEQAT